MTDRLQSAHEKPRVVIVGAGFGGLAAAKRLASADVEIVIIDKRNYHLFQPLLYQVATADLSPAEIAWPIRGIFSRYANIAVLLAEVTGLDPQQQRVITPDRSFAYDYLVLATGSTNHYFGHDEWEPFAPGLKRIIDATELRKRILVAFERAENSEDPEQQRRQLNFVIVGGGPTGVEMAGAIAELARVALVKDFKHIDPRDARIVLVEAGDRLLANLPADLSAYAKQALERLGVEVQLGKAVKAMNVEGAQIGDTFLPAATMIWGAGVAVENLGEWLGSATDRGGRVIVNSDLSVPQHPEVFVVGDAALAKWKDDLAVPGIAPAAKQAGRFVAERIRARLDGKSDGGAEFRYRHDGNLATIGRHCAVADLGWLKLKGWLAWWFWGIVHIFFLIGVRSAALVMLDWAWSYFTRKKGARLITGLRPLFKTDPAASAPGTSSNPPQQQATGSHE